MVVSFAYLRLLICLPAISIPACASFNPAFCMMYSALKLSKQGDNTHSWSSLFPIWNQSIVPCPVLTVASWPVHRFVRRQVKWLGIPISLRIFQFLVIHTVKGFGIVKKAKVDVFMELTSFFGDEADVSNLMSGSYKPAWTSGSSVHGSHTVEAWLGRFWALFY